MSIQEILTQAKNEKWPYPKTFNALKKMGTESYKVSFINSYKANYVGTFGTIQESAPAEYHAMHASEFFNGSAIKTAIVEHGQGKTSYIEFLEEIAAQGVSHYIVDMFNRTVTYFNKDESHAHVEAVPEWQG
ncbi:MAG: DUF1398 family protein [Candidatus Berkiella sp.]